MDNAEKALLPLTTLWETGRTSEVEVGLGLEAWKGSTGDKGVWVVLGPQGWRRGGPVQGSALPQGYLSLSCWHWGVNKGDVHGQGVCRAGV